MKIYVVGATLEELAKIEEICAAHGWKCQPASAWGRKPGQWPVLLILDAYERHGTARAAARVAEVSPGTAHRLLRRAGKI